MLAGLQPGGGPNSGVEHAPRAGRPQTFVSPGRVIGGDSGHPTPPPGKRIATPWGGRLEKAERVSGSRRDVQVPVGLDAVWASLQGAAPPR